MTKNKKKKKLDKKKPQPGRKLSAPPSWLPQELKALLPARAEIVVAHTTDELLALSCPIDTEGFFEVGFDVPGQGHVSEATVCRVKNGISVNYTDPYMRRRDPDCMFIGDDLPTDKPLFKDHFGRPFAPVREENLRWLAKQPLAVFAFKAGAELGGIDAVAVVPKNTAFFGLSLALLQGIVDPAKLDTFSPRAVIYVAPPFRHTHFDGRQVVVHNRTTGLHEVFSYNLYPGPSAKKGVYGVLINASEQQGWVAPHCATVQVVTPYDNRVTIMHEGASGGGKSEMLEHVHREPDGTLFFGENTVTKERLYNVLPRGCVLRPVNDDMAMCPPGIQKANGKLTIFDAEQAWFIRVNHIQRYGTDPDIEALSIHPREPLVFLNIDAKPGSTALIWTHTEDSPGKPCPNPRFILPRRIVPDVIQRPVSVDIRSFGVRTPPCTKQHPSYGMIGLFHVLPPALAWLWRLVSPRGFDNPSIVETEHLSSEGVGSYWPFATGRMVPQANLLLQQMLQTPATQYVLCPNQHIGAWRVGFMPQWLMREFLARRGGAWFRPRDLAPARCALLGYAIKRFVIEGQTFDDWFFSVERQPEVGEAAYDAGAQMLFDFFKETLQPYLKDDLSPLGKQIIDCCLAGGGLDDYRALIPGNSILIE